MRLLADLHTHSKNCRFGHGKNSIEEMAIAANEIGLVEIGITDHAYKHFFRTSKEKMKEARKIVDEINEWSKTKVLLGIEADIIDEDGTLDIDNETLSMLDILVVGYHRMTSTNFAGYFGGVSKTEEAKQKCTNAFVNAIRRYPVTVLAHLDSILETDMYEVGKACAERGTMVEINNRHTHWTREQMEDLIASECLFVLSSDAHSRNKVGSVERAMEFIDKYDIPSERIANVEFTEEEKSKLDREFDAYKSIYEKVAKDKQEREDQFQEKKRNEFVGSLSKEMEDELRKIAAEQGQEMSVQEEFRNFDGFVYDNMDENAKLLAEAEEYVRTHTQTEEFEEQHDHEHEEMLYLEEDIPLMSGETSVEMEEPVIEPVQMEKPEPVQQQPVEASTEFQNKFQSINNIVKETENEEVVKPSKPASSAKPHNSMFEINRTPSKKTVQVEKTAPSVEIKEPETVKPEDFMGSITRTRLIQNGGQAAEQKTATVPQKTATTSPRKKGPMGFIAVDNLIDGSKK